MRSVRGFALLAAVAPLLLGACRAPETESPEGNLLDREFAAYKADREERRLSDLEARAAKARADADRLEAELKQALADVEAKRIRLSDATKARLALPQPVHVPPGAATGPAPSPPAPAAAPPVPPVSPVPPSPPGAPR